MIPCVSIKKKLVPYISLFNTNLMMSSCSFQPQQLIYKRLGNFTLDNIAHKCLDRHRSFFSRKDQRDGNSMRSEKVWVRILTNLNNSSHLDGLYLADAMHGSSVARP